MHPPSPSRFIEDDLNYGATLVGLREGMKAFGGRFVLEKQIGRGGMGVVWLARDTELDRAVALKFLPEIVANDEEAVRDLRRETSRCLDLTHPNIVRVYDLMREERMAAICMEYVAGETLAKLKLDQPQGCFDVKTLGPWVRKACEALHYAHTARSVVHRDVKPANIMVDERREVKIMDFGVARTIRDSTSRVSVAAAGSSGTLVYMSPQQAAGQDPSASDDIYAFGVTLYELLTGKPPFYSGNIQHQIETITPPSVAERRTSLGVTGVEPVPECWERTLAACLSKDPKARPPTMAAVADMLNGKAPPASASAAMPGAKPVAAPPGARQPQPPKPAAAVTPRAKPRVLPKKLIRTAAIVVLAVSSISGTGYWWKKVEVPRRAQAARQAELQREEETRKAAEASRRAEAEVAAKEADRAARERAAIEAKNNIPIEVPPDLLKPLRHGPTDTFPARTGSSH